MIKKIYISAFLVCIGHLLMSQTQDNNFNGVSIGIFVAPQFISWNYKYDEEYKEVVEIMDSVGEVKNGMSFGINTDFYFNHKSSLKTGLSISLYPYETINMKANVEDPLLPCGNFSHSGTDYFIDLPILYKHILLKRKRINFFVGAGLLNKFLFYTRTKTYSICNGNNELIDKSGSVAKSFNYFISTLLEAGIDFVISEHLILGLSPSFEYSLINIKRDREITKKYYQTRINISAAWNF